jgi:hypothetical protein
MVDSEGYTEKKTSVVLTGLNCVEQIEPLSKTRAFHLAVSF